MAVVQTAAFLAGILAQGGLDFYHNESEFLATISGLKKFLKDLWEMTENERKKYFLKKYFNLTDRLKKMRNSRYFCNIC